MDQLVHAHSHMRYLVLVAAVGFIFHCFVAAQRRSPAGKRDRIIGALFVSIVDLQVLLGFALLSMGAYRPALRGHIAAMILVIVCAHGASIANRRRSPARSWMPLSWAIATLALIVAGIALTQPMVQANLGLS